MNNIEKGDFIVTQDGAGMPIFYKVVDVLKTIIKAEPIAGGGTISVSKETLRQVNNWYNEKSFDYVGKELPKGFLDLSETMKIIIDRYNKLASIEDRIKTALGKIKFITDDLCNDPDIKSLDGESEAARKAVESVKKSVSGTLWNVKC